MGKTLGLSDAKCRQAKYSEEGGNKLFDGGGLFLALMPSGSKKWRMKYRFNGKENLLTFGDYPTVTLADARQRRESVKRQLADGTDPALQREIDRQVAAAAADNTFKAVSDEWLRKMRWARWDEFDFDAKEWRVPAARMKGTKEQKASTEPHVVPLARQTIELLEQLRQFTGRYPLLFPGTKNRYVQPMSAETINKALKSLGFEGKQTGHGFRGLASTIMNDRSGLNPEAIERQLAHVVGGKVRRAYNHAQQMDERRQLMQWWADYIDQKAGDNVIPLQRPA
jgi:hypothetical protein